MNKTSALRTWTAGWSKKGCKLLQRQKEGLMGHIGCQFKASKCSVAMCCLSKLNILCNEDDNGNGSGR